MENQLCEHLTQIWQIVLTLSETQVDERAAFLRLLDILEKWHEIQMRLPDLCTSGASRAGCEGMLPSEHTTEDFLAQLQRCAAFHVWLF